VHNFSTKKKELLLKRDKLFNLIQSKIKCFNSILRFLFKKNNSHLSNLQTSKRSKKTKTNDFFLLLEKAKNKMCI